jgi:hypothetical protein
VTLLDVRVPQATLARVLRPLRARAVASAAATSPRAEAAASGGELAWRRAVTAWSPAAAPSAAVMRALGTAAAGAGAPWSRHVVGVFLCAHACDECVVEA